MFDFVAWALIVIFVVIFSCLAIGRHDSLKSYLNDLGTYDQVVWNTLHGHFFENSANMLGQPNYLGAHFSLILLVFVPIYALWSSPNALLLSQSLLVGLSGLAIYWFSVSMLKNRMVSLIFLFSFLMHPSLHNALLYDFHEVTVAIFFAAFAFYFLEKENYLLFGIFSALLALTQEHLVLLVLAMGIYIIFGQKRVKLGASVAILSLIYFILTLQVFMPFFSSSREPALLAGNSIYPSRYAWLGTNSLEIMRNIFFHPLAIGRVLLSENRIMHLVQLIIPVFSLALFSWPVLIALPLLIINFLSSLSMTYSIYFYHSAILIPFIYFTAILSFRRWFISDRLLTNLFAILIVLASIYAALTWSLTPLNKDISWSDYKPTAHAQKISEIQKIISADASLSVQHNLGPHFSERRYLSRFPLGKDSAQYILLDQSNPYESGSLGPFDFSYALQMNTPEWRQDISDLKASPNYQLIYSEDGYLLFKKLADK